MRLNPPPPPPPDETGRVVPLGDEPGMRERRQPNRPDEIIITKLKLNNEQVKKLEDLKKEHRNLVDSIQFSSKKLHDDYFGQLKNSPIDTAKANALLVQISLNQKELDKVTFSHFEKIRAICDNEQKELFNRFIDEIAGSFKPPKP